MDAGRRFKQFLTSKPANFRHDNYHEPHSVDMNAKELEAMIAERARLSHNGTVYNGLDMHAQAWKPAPERGRFCRTRLFYCNFHTTLGCPYRERVVEHGMPGEDDTVYDMQAGKWPHCDHYSTVTVTRWTTTPRAWW